MNRLLNGCVHEAGGSDVAATETCIAETRVCQPTKSFSAERRVGLSTASGRLDTKCKVAVPPSLETRGFEPGRQNDPGDPEAATGGAEQVVLRFWRHLDQPVGGMKQANRLNLPDECAVARGILAMNIRSNASTDRDGGVPRLDRQVEPPLLEKWKRTPRVSPASALPTTESSQNASNARRSTVIAPAPEAGSGKGQPRPRNGTSWMVRGVKKRYRSGCCTDTRRVIHRRGHEACSARAVS